MTYISPFQRSTFSNVAYTMLATDWYIGQIGTMSASRTITLVAANTLQPGTKIVIADESGTVTATNTIVIARSSTDTINGATSAIISFAYGSIQLECDGSSKYTIINRTTTTGGTNSILSYINGVYDIANGNILHSVLNGVSGTTYNHTQIDTHINSSTAHGATGAVVGTTNTQTLTNKSLSDSTTAIVDATDATKQIKFDANGTTGTALTIVGVQSANRSVTISDISGGSGTKLVPLLDSINLQLYYGTGNSTSVINTASIPESSNLYYTDTRVDTRVNSTILTGSNRTYTSIPEFTNGVALRSSSIAGTFDLDSTTFNAPGYVNSRPGVTISNFPYGISVTTASIKTETDDIQNDGGNICLIQYAYGWTTTGFYMFTRGKYSSSAKTAWRALIVDDIGVMSFFAMNSIPTGYIYANGSAISRTTYAALFAKISTTYGAGNGSTTFNVPDARAAFLRANGTNGNGWTAGTFGTLIADTLVSHTHSVSDPGHTHTLSPAGFWYYSGTSGRIQNFYTGDYYAAEAAGSLLSSTTGISLGNTGGSETVPKHLVQLCCIKAF